jgi:hypothetical protein
VGDRCTYVPGDMFHEVPPAEAYIMKRVLHDWNDAECLQILATMYRAAPQHGRVLIIERIIPGRTHPTFPSSSIFKCSSCQPDVNGLWRNISGC